MSRLSLGLCVWLHVRFGEMTMNHMVVSVVNNKIVGSSLLFGLICLLLIYEMIGNTEMV